VRRRFAGEASGLLSGEAGTVARKLFSRVRGEFPQAFDLPDEVALPGGELFPSPIVRFVRLLEAAADIVHVLEELDEFVVDAPGAVGDRLGVAIAALDLPHIGC